MAIHTAAGGEWRVLGARAPFECRRPWRLGYSNGERRWAMLREKRSSCIYEVWSRLWCNQPTMHLVTRGLQINPVLADAKNSNVPSSWVLIVCWFVQRQGKQRFMYDSWNIAKDWHLRALALSRLKFTDYEHLQIQVLLLTSSNAFRTVARRLQVHWLTLRKKEKSSMNFCMIYLEIDINKPGYMYDKKQITSIWASFSRKRGLSKTLLVLIQYMQTKKCVIA